MKSHWIEHKGKRVFIADYSHFGSDSASLKIEIDQIIEALLRESPSSVMSISNVEWTTASVGNIKILIDMLPLTNRVVRKRCVIGATGLSWKFIETFNQYAGKAQFRSFPTLEEARIGLLKSNGLLNCSKITL